MMPRSYGVAVLALLVAAEASAQGWRKQGFGTAAAVVGSDVLVSATPSGRWEPRGGRVHLFTKGSAGWVESAVIDPKVPVADKFGASLAATKDWLAVSAPGADSRGAVYLYRRRGAEWVQVSRVTPSAGARDSMFGASVALGNGVLVIGAPQSDSSRGAVYSVTLSGDAASVPVKLLAGTFVGAELGQQVAIRGNRLIVTAAGPGTRPPYVPPGATPPPPPPPAKVYLFKRSGSSWVADGEVTAPADAGSRDFGSAIGLVGDEIWVASTSADSSLGAVYRYGRSKGEWGSIGKLSVVPAATDGRRPWVGLGSAILVAGDDEVVIGSMSGSTYVFARNGGDWKVKQTIAPPENGNGANRFAAGEGILVLGSPNGAGFASVMTSSKGQWTTVSTLTDQLYELAPITGKEWKCEGGKVDQFECNNVELLAFLPISALGGDRETMLSGNWGWTDGETGREYALVGRSNGTSFVDVTDPSNPVVVGDLPLTPGAHRSYWRELKVYKDHVYVVSDGSGAHGMQVFDLARLRGVTKPTVFTPDTLYTMVASVHNIVIDTASGFAYAVGSNGGGETCGGALHMIDISSPKAPKFVGCVIDKGPGGTSGYIHDALCTVYRGPDQRFTGRQICFNSAQSFIGIVDVTDKTKPVVLAAATYPNVAYTHQGWLSEDHRYFFLDDELDEGSKFTQTRTLIFDMSKLDEPVLIKEFFGTTGATDHNLYVRGRYMYQANYVAGLRIIDVADPANPVEVGYFDTVPWGNNGSGFDGAWNNYPFFKSGTIVVNSIGQGLFILKQRKEQAVQ